MKFSTQPDSKENQRPKPNRPSLPLPSPRKALQVISPDKIGATRPLALRIEAAESIDDRIGKNGGTKLHIAVQKNDLAAAKVLLEAGATVDARNNYGIAPLHYAAKLKSNVMLKFLISNKASVNAQSDLSITPLHIAAKYGFISNLKPLLRNEANINAGDRSDMKPIHMAAKYGHTKTLQALLNSGAEANVFDKNGYSPLHYAYKNIDMIYALTKAGANPNIENKSGKTALHMAVKSGLVQNAKALIEAGSQFESEIFEDGKNSPMHIAATLKDPAMLKLLIEYKANADSMNEEGETPLHLAAEHGLIENVSLLLRGAEADFDAQDEDGETPLHKAVWEGHLEIVKLLIHSGADPTIKDIDDCSPIDDAEAEDKPEIMSFLQEVMAARDAERAREENEALQSIKRKSEDPAESKAKKPKDDSAYETGSSASYESNTDKVGPSPDVAPASPAKTLILFESPIKQQTDIANLADLEGFEALLKEDYALSQSPEDASPSEGSSTELIGDC